MVGDLFHRTSQNGQEWGFMLLNMKKHGTAWGLFYWKSWNKVQLGYLTVEI